MSVEGKSRFERVRADKPGPLRLKLSLGPGRVKIDRYAILPGRAHNQNRREWAAGCGPGVNKCEGRGCIRRYFGPGGGIVDRNLKNIGHAKLE